MLAVVIAVPYTAVVWVVSAWAVGAAPDPSILPDYLGPVLMVSVAMTADVPKRARVAGPGMLIGGPPWELKRQPGEMRY